MARAQILLVEARYYEDISDGLAEGAIAALEKAGAAYDRIVVPGALEVPGAIAMAEDAVQQGTRSYEGYVALGCVIRGETSHYDIVAGESARALMDLTVYDGVSIGNGILTVENHDQAWARADPKGKDKGGDAARAVLRMIELGQQFAEEE
ncbi:6,7-dimethyl-8-ribityllumazine synthase [Minwuia thermotolerans]|uniref:6,7-dimethyl-8-ribityllumazine synthase n=1 Tax=Minwuia thermotolerans TaxID=2056226 RepID=A0A2M9FZ10_9PROT|nr:6,7-dimethyl-8-ribityllumazine synthase [Minwuia thermotolerans]PJK28690.1 6,7-dimethyl-8-ribityllumazine synthase [Minwuia thermotolerans]